MRKPTSNRDRERNLEVPRRYLPAYGKQLVTEPSTDKLGCRFCAREVHDDLGKIKRWQYTTVSFFLFKFAPPFMGRCTLPVTVDYTLISEQINQNTLQGKHDLVQSCERRAIISYSLNILLTTLANSTGCSTIGK